MKRIKSPITNPYSPCVPGKSWITSDLPNPSGSSITIPAAASPAIPTPFADPAPDKNTAKAAPNAVSISPPFSIKNSFVLFLLFVFVFF